MEIQLGKSIRALRTQKGVTQETLADHLGISFQAVSKWEVGATTPDIGLLPDIAVYFAVSIDALFALPEDARLTRIENQLHDVRYMPQESFASMEEYLIKLLAGNSDHIRACYLLSLLYLRRADHLSERACEYARHAAMLKPESKSYLSTFIAVMGGLSGDMYANRHYHLIAFLREFVQEHPEIFHAHGYLMDHLLADGRLTEADELLTQMRVRFPRHARNLFYEGDIAYARGLHAEAAALWRQGVTDHDGPAGVGHFYRAERLERIEQYDEAITEYGRSFDLEEKPRFRDALSAMAQIYEMREEYQQAAAVYQEEIDLLQNEWGIISGERIDSIKRKLNHKR